MPTANNGQGQLLAIARRAMLEHGLQPDFPAAALTQLAAIHAAPGAAAAQARDLRALLLCSLDNHESRDLDQLTVAGPLGGGAPRGLGAIAGVEGTVAAGTPLDAHAGANTTSVYTPAQVFPMLPERLSTDLTTLAAGQERPSLI